MENLALKVRLKKSAFLFPKKFLCVYTERQARLKFAEQEAQTWRIERVTVHGKFQIRYRDKKSGRFIRKPEQ